MTALPQIIVTALTLGALYAVATLGLSLMWAALRLLNLAHGAMLAVGGYATYVASVQFGVPAPLAFVIAMGIGALLGWGMYWALVHPILRSPGFETNILIVTVGLGVVLENSILQTFGGQPYAQPLTITGAVSLAGVPFPLQNIAIVLASLALVALVSLFLGKTRLGLALRASSQERNAAFLMGMPVERLFSATMAIAGALTAASGVMISSITQLSPLLGSDPMLKAFVMCVLAGLGNLGGSVAAAFLLAIIEVAAQYHFGARWGLPTLLILVIGILIWKPNGLFSSIEVRRL